MCISITDSFQMDAFGQPVNNFSGIGCYFNPAK